MIWIFDQEKNKTQNEANSIESAPKISKKKGH